MCALLHNLWHDERGSMAADWAIIAAILVLGAITGVAVYCEAPLADTLAHPSATAPSD
jgi:hypothetical protein